MNTKAVLMTITWVCSLLALLITGVSYVRPAITTDILGDKRYKYMETARHASHEYVINTKTGYFIHSPACEKCR